MTRSRAGDTRLGSLVAILLLATNVASVSARLGFLHKAKQVKEYDHWRYLEMARGPEGRPELQREPPYCFRLAIPAAARGLVRLGFSENAAFFLLTNVALFGFLLLLWLHLRDLGFAWPLRVSALLLVGLTQGAVRWFEYQYWMTDPAALFLVMLAFFLLERRRWAGLAATSVVAAFVRETYVVVYPYVFLHELRRILSPREPTAPGAPSAAFAALVRAAALRCIAVAAVPFRYDDTNGKRYCSLALNPEIDLKPAESFHVMLGGNLYYAWVKTGDGEGGQAPARVRPAVLDYAAVALQQQHIALQVQRGAGHHPAA